MDALVKLYELPNTRNISDDLSDNGIVIRHAMAYEKAKITDWVSNNFSPAWADECSAAFNQQPITCLIAIKENRITGFACYECTQKNYFGPTGVLEKERKNGIGKALLVESLTSMKHLGYAYAIIGSCDGIEDFYKNTVGATPIPGSSPGIYKDKI